MWKIEMLFKEKRMAIAFKQDVAGLGVMGISSSAIYEINDNKAPTNSAPPDLEADYPDGDDG